MTTSPFDSPDLSPEHELRLLKAIGALSALYPRQTLSDANVEAYKLLLARFPVEAVEAAIMSWIHAPGHAFFPNAPELIERIGKLSIGDAGEGGFPTGEDAWFEVMQVRKEHGSYRDTPIWYHGEPMKRWDGWSHPVIEQAVQFVGGWMAICACTYEGEPSLRARFIGHVNALRDRERVAIQTGVVSASLASPRRDNVLGDGNEGEDRVLAEVIR